MKLRAVGIFMGMLVLPCVFAAFYLIGSKDGNANATVAPKDSQMSSWSPDYERYYLASVGSGNRSGACISPGDLTTPYLRLADSEVKIYWIGVSEELPRRIETWSAGFLDTTPMADNDNVVWVFLSEPNKDNDTVLVYTFCSGNTYVHKE